MKAKERKSDSGLGLRWVVLVVTVISLGGAMMASAQNAATTSVSTAPISNPSLVTINVDNGPITQVLNAFSRQTGRNIVIGTEVAGNVTLRVTDKPWQDALDVILKPYGFDYYMVGDTIIICSTDKLPKGVTLNKSATVATPSSTSTPVAPAPKPPEPLVVKVLDLKYLDTADIEDLVSKVSPSTKVGRLFVKSQSWDDKNQTSGQNQSTSSESLGRLNRIQEESKFVRSKTVVLVDTQDKIDQLMAIISQIDVMPSQIQIEAKFVEVSANFLRDVGVEWGSGVDGLTPGVKTIGTSGAGSLYAAGAQQISGAVKPAAFTPQSADLAGKAPFNGGLSFAFQKLTDLQFSMLLHLMEEDVSYNMLSSPRILTMNNQDAVIIVGQKLPIIRSDASGTAGSTTISTTLDRYEDIGIKLKVLPQVCEGDYINLIVHPSVRELLGYQSGKVGAAADTSGSASSLALTEYPMVATREAETQVMIKSGQTIVIGGLLREKKTTSQLKVPVLGSIPLLGVLFRRETVNTEKIELLIFLTAKTVRNTADELSVTAPDIKTMIKAEKAKTPAKP